MRQATDRKRMRLFLFLFISVLVHIFILSFIHLDTAGDKKYEDSDIIFFPIEEMADLRTSSEPCADEEPLISPKNNVENKRLMRKKNQKKNHQRIAGQALVPVGTADGNTDDEHIVHETIENPVPDKPILPSEHKYTVANAPPIKLALSSSGGFIDPDTNKIIPPVSDICVEAAKQGKFAPLCVSYGASAKALGIDLALVATGEHVIVPTVVECEDGDDGECVGIGTVSKAEYEQMQQEEMLRAPNEKQITVGSEFPYCKDGLDDDGDGLVDFEDPDCHGSPTNIPIDNLKYLKPGLKAIENLLESK